MAHSNLPEIPRQSKNRAAPFLATLFWLFLIGSVVGYLAEGLWDFISMGQWRHHVGTVWGPFCVIYGVGAVAAYILACLLHQRSFFQRFLGYSGTGALVEYLGSLLQELILGSRSWDYSAHLLNINGRISLQMALLWGVLGVAFTEWVFPGLQRFFRGWHSKKAYLLTIIVALLMTVNLIMTSLALLRWAERIHNVPADGIVDMAMDRWFDDDKMSELYFNMSFSSPPEYESSQTDLRLEDIVWLKSAKIDWKANTFGAHAHSKFSLPAPTSK